MKKLTPLLYAILLLLACHSGSKDYPAAENALDAGREFIQACLQGEFEKAGAYMVPDAENQKWLETLKNQYRARATAEQKEYEQAAINIAGVEELSDTSTLIHYSNSYDKIARKLKIVHRDNRWLVDFKYTFNGNL